MVDTKFASLNIAICGGGIAGLACAIALNRDGHRVTVFERSPATSEFGAALSIHHNTSHVLHQWGFQFELARAVVQHATRNLQGDTLEQIAEHVISRPEGKTHDRYAMLRRDFIKELLRLAMSHDEAAISKEPVRIEYGALVTGFDEEAGIVHINDDRQHASDLVVLADGVHSKAPQHLNQMENMPKQWTSMTVVRFLVDTDDLVSDARTASLVADDSGTVQVYRSPSGQLLVQYDAGNGTVQNWALFTFQKDPDSVQPTASRFNTTRAEVLDQMVGFHSSLQTVIGKASEPLSAWQVIERDPLPRWHSKRVLVLGEAAHAMAPLWGQGANMAIEDAAALAILLQHMPSKWTGLEFSSRLEAFEKLRKPRTSVVAAVSGVLRGGYEKQKEKLSHYFEQNSAPETDAELRDWVIGYDILAQAEATWESLNLNRS